MSTGSAANDAVAYPGERLGLPDEGPRSIGRLGRRIGAILIDWLPVYFISFVFFKGDAFATLAMFAVLQIVFIALLSGSIGHLIVGLRVVPLKSGWIGLWRPALRTVLLCLAVPALIWDRDQRGLHDKAAGTVLVRR